jgi:hypothetical protein
MKPLNAILSASGLVLALSLSGWAEEVKQFPTQTVTLSGTLATAPTGATSTAPSQPGQFQQRQFSARRIGQP